MARALVVATFDAKVDATMQRSSPRGVPLV